MSEPASPFGIAHAASRRTQLAAWQIESAVVEEQAIDALLKEADVSDTNVGFEEFMRPESNTEAVESV